MRILHISTHDINGGASKSAYRIHRGLLAAGVDSQMLVMMKSSRDETVHEHLPGTTKILTKLNLLEKPERWVANYYKTGGQIPFSPTFFSVKGILQKIDQLNPDIVNLHWVYQGFLNAETIGKIKQPVVWTLHDMWSFTGGCHYDEECGKWKQSCGACPMLESQNARDLSHRVFQRKRKVYEKMDKLTIVGTSKWLSDCARESVLFQGKRVENLPSAIDPTVFKPIDKQVAREILNLPQDKKLILFGAHNATSDKRKGFHYLQKAIQHLALLPDKDSYEVVIFGADKPKGGEDYGLKSNYLGRINDELSLSIIYSCADVMVAPSLQENLANTILEPIACGTPVVGFHIGGNPDMIDHKKNGYLANPLDSKDLAKGISWVVADEMRNKELSKMARQKALDCFAPSVVGNHFKSFYQSILNKRLVPENLL